MSNSEVVVPSVLVIKVRFSKYLLCLVFGRYIYQNDHPCGFVIQSCKVVAEDCIITKEVVRVSGGFVSLTLELDWL